MVKKIITIHVCLLCMQLSYGQMNTVLHNKPVSWSLYAEGGLCQSSFQSQEKNLNPDFSSLSGFNIGVGVNLRFKDNPPSRSVSEGLFAIQSGIHYFSSGFKEKKEKVVGDYISIPVFFQYYPLSQFYGEVGLEMCVNTGLSPTSAEIMGMNIDLHNHHANDCKFGIGAGCYFPIKKKAQSIGVSAKYMFGTTDFAENLPWRNNQFRINVFYRFGL